jgi:hypothetical protein
MELHVKNITFYYIHYRMTVTIGVWDLQPNVKCSHNEIKLSVPSTVKASNLATKSLHPSRQGINMGLLNMTGILHKHHMNERKEN